MSVELTPDLKRRLAAAQRIPCPACRAAAIGKLLPEPPG